MSKRKDRERAKEFLYRGGQKVSRRLWDAQQRQVRAKQEEQRLKALGLITSKPNLLVAQRVGLEKGAKQVMTPAEIYRRR